MQTAPIPAIFLQEAEPVVGMEWQNVARVYEIGTQHGLHYVITEVFDGETIAQRLVRRGPMRLDEALVVWHALASACAELHGRDIVHGLIHPARVQVARDGHIKLPDTGYTLPAGPQCVPPAIFEDSNCVAPEVWEGRNLIGPWSDVRAIAVLFAYLVTGQPWIPTESDSASWCKDHDPPAVPFQGMSPSVQSIYERCVARDLRTRIQSADALLRELSAVGIDHDAALTDADYGQIPSNGGEWARRTLSEMELRNQESLALQEDLSRDVKPAIHPAWAPIVRPPQVGEVDLLVDCVEEGRRRIDSVANLPLDFDSRRKALRELHVVAREIVAHFFEPVLNTRAREMPRSTYEEKKALANWVNEELRQVGLAIRCPKTGEPALLRGTRKDVEGEGRYYLEIADGKGGYRRTLYSVDLPELRLRPADLGREPYGGRAR